MGFSPDGTAYFQFKSNGKQIRRRFTSMGATRHYPARPSRPVFSGHLSRAIKARAEIRGVVVAVVE
jgi:hypothetical protein